MSFYAPLNKAVLRRPLEPELRPAVGVVDESSRPTSLRFQIAISNASRARSVRSERQACQPTMKRLNTSMMNATYTHPAWVLT
jgi:hypothetical protein